MKKGAYYNEIDPYAAQWLRNLIKKNLIAPGDVDERSIEDVIPSDLHNYAQCHFFAGIGVWSLALRRAGWPDDSEAWTGSCPCQPFSAAGKGAGFDDERHLWPAWFHLIEQCRPTAIFGEQVASKDADPWIDLVQADVETMGYAFGAVPFPSAGVGAPHIRDRLYWVGHTSSTRLEGHARNGGTAQRQRSGRPVASTGVFGGVGNPDSGTICRDSSTGVRKESKSWDKPNSDNVDTSSGTVNTGPTNGYWRAADWIGCADGKWRPVEPGTFPLAHGAPARVGRLRAYGNAINAQAAQAFIEAFLDGGEL